MQPSTGCNESDAPSGHPAARGKSVRSHGAGWVPVLCDALASTFEGRREGPEVLPALALASEFEERRELDSTALPKVERRRGIAVSVWLTSMRKMAGAEPRRRTSGDKLTESELRGAR